MLNRETFARGIQIMNSIIIKPLNSDDTMDMYFMVLEDLEPDAYIKGMLHLVKTKKYIQTPFSPGEIREASELFSGNNEIVEKIITQIHLDIIKYGSNRKPKYKPEIEDAINKAGGWGALCFSEGDELNIVLSSLKENVIDIVKHAPNYLENKHKLLN